MKRFNVVLKREDGGVEVHAMKEWLRQHADHVPSGLDATSSTSHQLRNGLKKSGWSVQETDTETRLSPPGTTIDDSTIDDVLGNDDETDASQVSDQSFALEYQLRDFIANNLATIPIMDQTLELYVDPTGRDGIEYPTAVGPIDILARDSNGNFFVFELKRGRSPDYTMGQLTRYMGWVKHTIGREHQVFGVIVAKRIDDKLRYAASVVPNTSLLEYQVQFSLHSADRVPTA
jgi:hypothetical protein